MNLEEKCGRDLLNLKHNGLTCITLCALQQNNQNRKIKSLNDQKGNKRMTNQPCIGNSVSPNVKDLTIKTSFSYVVPPNNYNFLPRMMDFMRPIKNKQLELL